jgi:glycosyltransferase involved in cell wall biosynthesis
VARVALVCEPPDGGVAEHVRHLALGLPAHGHDPVVLGPSELPFRRDYRHPHRDAQALAKLARMLRGFDLVHAHAAKAGVLARLAAAAARRPAVYTPHCFPFAVPDSPARRRFGLAVERALAPLTDTIVCVCEQERGVAIAARVRPRGRLAVVRNGCPGCAGAADPELARLRQRGPVVGAVAVLRRQKRLDVLLAAAPRILDAVPEATVVVVGNGPEGEALRAAADPRVVFLPFRGPADRYLQALDLYVLPSDWEAFPISVLEAQACGVPQVATDVGGTREALVPETGVLVPSGDPEALAAAIVGLLRDPERRAAMGDASRRRHAERFTVDRMVAETAAVYDAVLPP